MNKKVPRPVKIWLGLLGFWGGLISMLIVTSLSFINASLGFNIYVALFCVSVVVGVVIHERNRDTLVEWGLVKPRKKKETETE